MGTYHTAQICLNGHVITQSADRSPELTEKHCSKCGAETITLCQNCSARIRGFYDIPNVVSLVQRYILPRFCYECGNPYPWTQKKLKAAKELTVELDELSDKEKEVFKKSLDALVRDTPETEVSAIRIKKLLVKTGETGAVLFRNILVDILSETAKKSLGM
jgi:hypothetical protein